MKAYFYVLLLALLCGPLRAHASPCDAPPYGDNPDNWNKMVDATATADNIRKVLMQSAFISACRAKFEHGDRTTFHQNGIADETIDDIGTVELALAWMGARDKALTKEFIANHPEKKQLTAAAMKPPPVPQVCRAYPYGSTTQQIESYHAAVFPRMGQRKSGEQYVVDDFIESVCRMKYRDYDRKPLHDYGIADLEIDRTDPATLTGRLLVAANFQITLGGTQSYEIGERVKRESVHDGIYAPIICSAGFCNGPTDPAYVFPSLGDCKRYLGALGMAYIADSDPSNKSMHGFCAKHTPEWEPVR